MRLSVQGEPGALADAPGEALSALADCAAADGADRVEWLEKAMASAGATGRSVLVAREPRHKVVEEAVLEADRVYRLALTLANGAIRERLQQAVRDADVDRYRSLLGRE